MRKYYTWNIVVVKFQVCLVVKEPVSQSPARSDGHGCEERLARNVAQRIHALDVGVLEGVGEDVASSVHLQANLLRPKLSCVGSPANSPEKDICGSQDLVIVETDHNSLIILLNLGNLDIPLDLYPAVLNLLCDSLRDLRLINVNDRTFFTTFL